MDSVGFEPIDLSTREGQVRHYAGVKSRVRGAPKPTFGGTPLKPAPSSKPPESPKEPPQKTLNDVKPLDCSHLRIIQRESCVEMGIDLADLLCDRRSAPFPLVRQVAMFICWKMTSKSLPLIGKAFGRDHTTVIHSCRKIGGDPTTGAAGLYETSPEIRATVDTIMARCATLIPPRLLDGSDRISKDSNVCKMPPPAPQLPAPVPAPEPVEAVAAA